MAYDSVTHDPDAVLDYQWDWSDFLATDTIADATFTVYTGGGAAIPESDTAPITVDSSSFTDTTATAWISGGQISNSPYLVVCHITTAAGREEDKTLAFKIKEK